MRHFGSPPPRIIPPATSGFCLMDDGQECAKIREAAFGVFDDVGTQFLEGVRVIYIGKPIPIMEKGAAFVPASVLAPAPKGEKK